VEFLVEGIPFDGFPSPSVWFTKGYSLCVFFFPYLKITILVHLHFLVSLMNHPSFRKTNYHGSHACNLTSPQLPCYVLIWIVP
jgi:hypothetical protein